MADYENRHTETIPGEFFTDEICITCDQCFTDLPSVFKLADDGLAVVYRQPEGEAEIADAIQAMEDCPVEAIGQQTATLA